MPIVGLTDRMNQPDHRILGRVEISVFKGNRKPTSGYGFGKDLNQNLRIATANNVASIILKQAYGAPDKEGDFITDKINIYLPFDEVERTFSTNMKAYEASGLKMVCDRHTISKKCVPTQDSKGNTFRPIVEVAEECPMRGRMIGEQCPNGCQKEGKLYFYIRELFDKNMAMPCVLTTHSYEDLLYIPDTLEQIKSLMGSLTVSPQFPTAYQWSNKIPFVLSRSEVKIKRPVIKDKVRTGTKSDGTTWALTIQVDPNYMEMYRKWQQVLEMESRRIAISPSTIAGLLSGDTSTVIDVEVVAETPKQLPAAKSRADRCRERIAELTNEYLSVTGEDYQLPNLAAMTEQQLIDFGITLAQAVKDAKQAIPVIESGEDEDAIDYDPDPEGRQVWQSQNQSVFE